MPLDSIKDIDVAYSHAVAQGDVDAQHRLVAEALRLRANYEIAGDMVDGLAVREAIPNQASIDASVVDYEVLSGIREVPLSEFHSSPKALFYAANDIDHSERLAQQIQETGEINPLIVVVGDGGPYILEGGHRLGGLHILGAKSFPAQVVIEFPDEPIVRDDQGEVLPLARRFCFPIREEDARAEEQPQKCKVTPEQDAAYLAAVNRGDLPAAKAMVTKAATEAGFDTPIFHGGKRGVTGFRPSSGGELGGGVYMSKDERFAHEFTKDVRARGARARCTRSSRKAQSRRSRRVGSSRNARSVWMPCVLPMEALGKLRSLTRPSRR